MSGRKPYGCSPETLHFTACSEPGSASAGKEAGANIYSMVSVSYKAIQEQQEMIEQLQEKDKQKDREIDKLIKRIETLEKEAKNGNN